MRLPLVPGCPPVLLPPLFNITLVWPSSGRRSLVSELDFIKYACMGGCDGEGISSLLSGVIPPNRPATERLGDNTYGEQTLRRVETRYHSAAKPRYRGGWAGVEFVCDG